MKKTSCIFNWKGFHKWVGISLSVFIIIFCISGIILNHRRLFSGCGVDRRLMPAAYSVKDFNNAIIKGTLPLDGDRIIAYGYAGAWLTDRNFSTAHDFNSGLPGGVDGRNIRNIVRTRDGRIWCAAQYGIYLLNDRQWIETPLDGHNERVTDIALAPDSCSVVAMTRNAVYTQSEHNTFCRHELQAPENRNDRVTLFKSLWMLHSGELFGTAGRVIVDLIALIIAFLCITGIILLLLPYSIRKSAGKQHSRKAQKKASSLRWNMRWHDRIGFTTLVLTILIAFTGMCLRPPMMRPTVLIKTPPFPGSALDNPNPWHNRLRALRWDDAGDCWIVSTSEGFFRIDRGFTGRPQSIPASQTPPVSPMGITVFEKENTGTWLIGSFSGLYRWNHATGSVVDYLSGETCSPSQRRSFAGDRLVSGYSADFDTAAPVVFDYSSGTSLLPEMPVILSRQPISLWNFALELHVGRCYTPFLGPFSELFVFLSGLLLILILVSGLIIRNRHRRKQRKHNMN